MGIPYLDSSGEGHPEGSMRVVGAETVCPMVLHRAFGRVQRPA